MHHVVMYSGGAGAYGAAKRVVERQGAADLTLLFTDTLIEDPDLYRFLDESAALIFRNMPPRLVKIADGRDIWQVFRDERFLGNSLIDPCSKILKRQMADRWLRENCNPNDTVVYLGIDWTEAHRYDDGDGHGAKHRYAKNGWQAEAPLTEAPYVSKGDIILGFEASGVRRPRLYRLGFPHNNCGGGCIKAGIAHFVHLLRTLPDVYAIWEEKEQEMIAFLARDVSILTETVNGVPKTLTLKALRERIEAGAQYDIFAWGGCGCFEEAA